MGLAHGRPGRWLLVTLCMTAALPTGRRQLQADDRVSAASVSDGAFRIAMQPAEENPPLDPPPSLEPQPSDPTPPPPPAPRPAYRPAPETLALALPRYRRSRFRLASVPNMYGDTLPPGGQISASKGLAFVALADLPLAGGSRRLKVAENNKALPMDRVIFNYNHFHNSRSVFYDAFGPPVETDDTLSIDRYVVGLEKTFLNENVSLDVRLPLVDDFSFSAPSPAFSIAGGEVGNLHATLKGLLYADDRWAFSAGLGVDVPTGSDVRGAAEIEAIAVDNDAVHVSPFAAFLGAPDDTWFTHGFLEVDCPLNGHGITVRDVTGTLNEQTLLNVDLAVGAWLVRCPQAPLLTGIAAVAELHYTTTLNDADLVTMMPTAIDYAFSNFANRMDLVNVTLGIHTELARHTTLRIGGVLPLNDGDNRLFDTELLFQLNRYF